MDEPTLLPVYRSLSLAFFVGDLVTLGCVAAAQIWTGVALSSRAAPKRQPATAS